MEITQTFLLKKCNKNGYTILNLTVKLLDEK